MSSFVQQFDSVPQFWQFIRGLRSDDLLVELIQNELDANASHTTIAFMPDRLVCHGDGDSISQDGWLRLAYVMGAGDQVERKQFRIGIKNHGLKACFCLGDEIILRSAGLKMIQTLHKDGESSHPSPGTLSEPVLDRTAPLTGCSVEVPYRRRKLVVMKGEPLTLDPPDDESLEAIFRKACDQLASRLLGVVRPGIRDQYTLRLSHHALGAVELHWKARRPRSLVGRGQRRFLIFRRECITASDVSDIPASAIYEQACTFRIPFPPGQRPEISEFFKRDKRSFSAEIAWVTNKSGIPRSTVGIRRYPIGFDVNSESALTGVGVHYSAPFISDAERHGISQIDSRNGYIDDACKDALVDIMASYLLHRHGARAMVLYLPGRHPEDDLLRDLLNRTIERRALPIRHRALRATKRSKRIALGPRGTSRDGLRRIVLPMYTWDRNSVSPLLSKICPSEEDQIDRAVPSVILSCLSECSYSTDAKFSDIPITFDENDVIERLQPRIEAQFFPWKDESDWRKTLGDPSICSTYLDVAYETIANGKMESELDVLQKTYVADERSMAQPLAELFGAVRLPPNLGVADHVPILHPKLLDHRLLRKPAWKPKLFTLDNFLDNTELETASPEERELFWNWLRKDWRNVKRQTLIRICALPVWPSSYGCLVTLDALCEPRDARVASILGDAIIRPSHKIKNAGIVRESARRSISFRNEPTRDEIERFLSTRLDRFPRDRQLTLGERREFHELENDLATLAASTPSVGGYLGGLSEEYGTALAKDGSLKLPQSLVRDDGRHMGLHPLDRHVIDRPNRTVGELNGWAPRVETSARQIVEALREDGDRHEAHIPRLAEYVKQAKREGISTTALTNLSCIPVNGQLRSPDELALRGHRNFWGDWKIEIPMTHISPEVQRVYRTVGVVGGSPDPASSRRFFQWLASQHADVILKHTDQILRHINHKRGPHAWSDDFPSVPFIPVESAGCSVRLVTIAESVKSRSKVVIPDFRVLEEEIRQDARGLPVEMAIVQSRRVGEAITSRLREFGLRTLSGYAGDPLQVVGVGAEALVPNSEFRRILDSLQSGLTGRQLQKRLSTLDLDTSVNALRGNWRQRLAGVRDAKTAVLVTATYRLGRRRFSVTVDAKLDEESGTLWIRSDSDHRSAFFDVVADRIFEEPKKYFGLVLEKAYKIEFRDWNRQERDDEVASPDHDSNHETANHEVVVEGPWATSGVHSIPNRQSVSDLPDPGPIPPGYGTISSVGRNTRRTSRTYSEDEKSQIEDLKKKHYAWHCQACIAGISPKKLAPLSSYVAISENRRRIMDAHHCDHVNAGGSRHAGNIVLLCHYHHRELGDAITRSEVTRALAQAGGRRLTFGSEDGVSKTLDGSVVTIHPPQRQNAVSLFFTKDHADFWLSKATEDALI